MTDEHLLSAGELLDRYRRGDTDPVSAVEECLARIDEVDGAIGAVVARCDDEARIAARESAERWADSSARPLEGVPFGVKDIIETAGLTTAVGSALYADHVPRSDAEAVARLRAAGAVLVAKTATPEFAFGDEQGVGVRNPWATDRWVGGSSSGSAAALAARQVPIALGTDTGGSIRVPASYCGVTGLKPTFGRVPRDGVFPVSWTLDHVGPMARTVEDVARVLSVVAGVGRDPYSSDRPVDDYLDGLHRSVEGLRVGVVGGWLTEACAPGVLAARDATVEQLHELGATTTGVELPHAELSATIAWVLTVAEFASHHEARLGELDALTPSAAQRVAAGARLSALDYTKALRSRELIQRDMDAAFADVDVLLTPATPTAAPDPTTFFDDGDRLWLEKVARTFLIFNVTGMPALVLPSGFDGGVPTSVQIAARPFDEATCLRVGAALQAASDHHLRRPT